MARRKARRTRSPHPGIVIFRRKSNGQWRARWRNPDDGRWRFQRLDGPDLQLTNAEARVAWAKTKSESLAKRRAAIASGAPQETRTAVAAACKMILTSVAELQRPATVAGYRTALEGLAEWAGKNGVEFIEELEPRHLAAYREKLITRKRTVPVRGRGAKQGTRRATDRTLSIETRNGFLRDLSAVINRLRKLGLTPRLSRDSIAESLERLRAKRPQITPLRSAELQAILHAAMRHDAHAWTETREEHRGDRPRGTTARYQSIALFLATAMLTGCRAGELLTLEWADVDLDAPDDHGNAAGEIRLPAEKIKTGIGRTVTLEVAPRLRTMLLAMRVQAGGAKYVFGGPSPLAKHATTNARKRMIEAFGAPTFTLQGLRQTCGTYLTCAPGIFGSASAYRSAAQLGHSVAVAQKHYLGLVRGIPREAKTLDQAMGIEAAMDALLAVVRGDVAARGAEETQVAVGA